MSKHENISILATLVVLVMLAVPFICLASAIGAAPYAKSAPARPGGDGAFLAVIAVLLIAALFGIAIAKREQFVEYQAPAAELPDALWMAAHTDLTTSIEMGEVTPGQAKIISGAIKTAQAREFERNNQ